MMKTTLGERLKLFIAYKKLSYAEFGLAFEATKGEVNNWCSGTKINVDRLSRLVKAYPELNIYWLLLDKGEMLNNSTTITSVISNSEVPDRDVELLRERIKLLEENISLRKKIDELQKK